MKTMKAVAAEEANDITVRVVVDLKFGLELIRATNYHETQHRKLIRLQDNRRFKESKQFTENKVPHLIGKKKGRNEDSGETMFDRVTPRW